MITRPTHSALRSLPLNVGSTTEILSPLRLRNLPGKHPPITSKPNGSPGPIQLFHEMNYTGPWNKEFQAPLTNSRIGKPFH